MRKKRAAPATMLTVLRCVERAYEKMPGQRYKLLLLIARELELEMERTPSPLLDLVRRDIIRATWR